MASPIITVIANPGGESNIWPLVAILISILTGGFSIWWSFRTEKRGYLDNFWFREITAPHCIQPAIEMQRNWLPRIESLANTALSKAEYQKIMGDLEAAINLAISRAWVSKIFKSSLYDLICARYEALSDQVANGLQKYVDSSVAVPAAVAISLSSNASALLMAILAESAKANAAKLKLAKL
jgi:hypothetical protein